MGTIASVLQWTCSNCNLINPTECLKCLNCGNFRRILAEDSDAQCIIDDIDDRHEQNQSKSSTVENIEQKLNSEIDKLTVENNQKSASLSSLSTPTSSSTASSTPSALDKQFSQITTTDDDVDNNDGYKSATTKTINKSSGATVEGKVQKTLPGYVEINSNG